MKRGEALEQHPSFLSAHVVVRFKKHVVLALEH